MILSACQAPPPIPTADKGLPTPTPIVRFTPAPDERVWPLPGALGTTHELTGTLTAAASYADQVTATMGSLAPGSPSRSSRSVTLSLTCEADNNMSWHFEPFSYEEPDSTSEDFVCDEIATVYFSYDYNYRRIVITALPTADTGDIHYKLTAAIHIP